MTKKDDLLFDESRIERCKKDWGEYYPIPYVLDRGCGRG
jgi:hypothetical protein